MQLPSDFGQHADLNISDGIDRWVFKQRPKTNKKKERGTGRHVWRQSSNKLNTNIKTFRCTKVRDAKIVAWVRKLVPHHKHRKSGLLVRHRTTSLFASSLHSSATRAPRRGRRHCARADLPYPTPIAVDNHSAREREVRRQGPLTTRRSRRGEALDVEPPTAVDERRLMALDCHPPAFGPVVPFSTSTGARACRRGSSGAGPVARPSGLRARRQRRGQSGSTPGEHLPGNRRSPHVAFS